MKLFITFLSVILLISSCSAIDTGRAHKISFEPIDIVSKRRTAQHLIVNYPAAVSELDTFRIAVMYENGKRDYLAGSRWAEFLPSIVQDSMLKTIRNSRLFNKVSSDQIVNDATYRLDSEILHFEVLSQENGDLNTNIEISFVLVNLNNLNTVSQFTLKSSKPIEGTKVIAISQAFAETYISIQRQLIKKLARSL